MGGRLKTSYDAMRNRVTPGEWPWRRPTSWEKVAASTLCIVIVVLVFFVWRHYHPPVGVYIAIMGFLAAGVTLRKEPSLPEKALWILVITFLVFAEVQNLYVAENKQVKTFAHINGELEESLAQTTGGDSFCYLDIAPVAPNQLLVKLVHRGSYPVFNVVVTLNDVDAFYKGMQSGDLTSSRRFFPAIEVVPVFSFGQPLAIFPIGSDATTRTFTAEIDARNGVFSEVVLVDPLKNGGAYRALRVKAWFSPTKQGIVLEQIDKDFPRDLLEKNQEWNRFDNLKRLKTSTDVLTGQ
jgi:hypothetical protein